MDSYQPIFDAIRSRISNGDIGQEVVAAVREANIPHYVERVAAHIDAAAASVAQAYSAPSAVYRPALSVDGDQWCALYGDNLQDGMAGFGDTAAAAMADFDAAWVRRHARISA